MWEMLSRAIDPVTGCSLSEMLRQCDLEFHELLLMLGVRTAVIE